MGPDAIAVAIAITIGATDAWDIALIRYDHRDSVLGDFGPPFPFSR